MKHVLLLLAILITGAFGEADVQTFCRIFDRLSKEGISNPTELYRKGIMEYLEYGNNERKTETDVQ